jgi:hypothetical protein
MQRYLKQLIDDISNVIENATISAKGEVFDLHDWIPEEEEDQFARISNLHQLTGISQDMLPPADMLNDKQIICLLDALQKMLDMCNCSVVLQTEVPAAIVYETIRNNFNQDIKIKRWHMGFFELCEPGTEHKKCMMGEYCQCAFYADLFSGCDDEILSPEEERSRALDIELQHIKRKYGDDWLKYYPYHLDPNYDDENGMPYNYGFDEDEEEDDDNWWRR